MLTKSASAALEALLHCPNRVKREIVMDCWLVIVFGHRTNLLLVLVQVVRDGSLGCLPRKASVLPIERKNFGSGKVEYQTKLLVEKSLNFDKFDHQKKHLVKKSLKFDHRMKLLVKKSLNLDKLDHRTKLVV